MTADPQRQMAIDWSFRPPVSKVLFVSTLALSRGKYRCKRILIRAKL